MKRITWSLITVLTISAIPVRADEPTTANEALKDTSTQTTQQNASEVQSGSSTLDPAMQEAKGQEATLTYCHDAFKKSRMAQPAKGASLASMLSRITSKDPINYQNWNTVCLDYLYEGKKAKALEILNQLESASSGTADSITVLAGTMYYFAIACYCDGDLDNAEKIGLKCAARYVSSGSKDFMDTSNLKCIYFMLALINEKQGKSQESLDYAKKGTAIKNL